MLANSVKKIQARRIAIGLALAIGSGFSGVASAEAQQFGSQVSIAAEKASGMNKVPDIAELSNKKLGDSPALSTTESKAPKETVKPLTELNLGPSTEEGKIISELMSQKRIQSLQLEVEKLKQEREKLKDDGKSPKSSGGNQAVIEQIRAEHEKQMAEIFDTYGDKIRSINYSLNKLTKALETKNISENVFVTAITMFNNNFQATFLVDGDWFTKTTGDSFKGISVLSIDSNKVTIQMEDGTERELNPISPEEATSRDKSNNSIIGLLNQMKIDIQQLKMQKPKSVQTKQPASRQGYAQPMGGINPFSQ